MPRLRSLAVGFAGLLAGVLLAGPARAQDPVTDFRQNCASCHTIGGGRLQGPDLKGVSERQERDWLLRFIRDPGGVIDAGDPYAVRLLQEARGVRMPNVAGMSADRAARLLDLIEAESKLEKSQFAGVQISERPFTREDVDRGRRLFLGQERLGTGGASCVSCHHVGGLGGVGGGRLGPDLTKVFERYEGRRPLATWLTVPATPTMLPTYKARPLTVEQEILPLVAWFEHAARTQQEEARSLVLFHVLGVGGAALLLVLAGRIWSFRLHGVRKPLVLRARRPSPPGAAPPAPLSP